MPAQQKALLLLSKQGKLAVETREVPTPNENELLVKITSTALNPVDWKIQAYGYFVEEFPAVLGSDAAGIVEEVGAGVTSFVKGDKVFFQGWFDNRQGTFQQYAIVPAEITAKLPSNISLDEAASIPLGLATATVALYNQKGDKGTSARLAAPWEEGGKGKYAGKPIFILGGASSVGQYVIQVAKLSGFSPIITTASLKNATLLTSLGATHVIDRNLSAEAARAEVAKVARAPVELVYDTISVPDTENLGYDVLAPGGHIVLTLPDQIDPAKKTPEKKIVNVFGNVHREDNRALGVSLYSKLTQLIEEGAIKPNHAEVLPNGLEGIIAGLDRLKNNQVSGTKLIARPQETV